MLKTEVTVALQGTLDTFALPDVLRLLASTKKVGRLRVIGDAGSGSLWVDGGAVVGSELLVRGADADSLTEVLFNLLRFVDGSFTFEAGSTPHANGDERDVESVIVEAELMLGEWRALEPVVPSLDAWLSLAQELKGCDAVIDSARWRIIVTVGSGATVGEVGRRVGLGELAVMRAVKEVIELGLLEVSADVPAVEPAYAEQAVDVPMFTNDTPLDDPSEIARQLANLSPRAARAVAAAAKATTEEEREAALATIEAEDETINRGLLLKFLGAIDG